MLTVFLVVTPAAVSAQSSTPPVATAQEFTLQGPDVYPISLLGYTDQIMNGPYSFARIRFRLPDTWALNSGASIQLHIRNILTSTSGMTENELVQATGATLEVHFNSEWVTTLVLDWVGDKTVTVPVPVDALATKTGQYTLSFYLDAGIDCNFDHQTTVVILSDSVLDMQHDFVTPAVDLTLLPRPIYQQNSTLASPASSLVTAQDMGVAPAVIVVPDQPDQAELQAALIVSAGFGYLTNGNLVLNTVPVSQFTPEMKNNSQVILVGKAANLGILSEVTLPLSYSGAKFDSPDLTVEDGVIMEAVSPWNPLNLVLVVSSESDAGLVNAAKAVSSGFVQVGDRPDVAIVSGVTALPVGTSIPEVQTLADLGFATTQLSGLNYNLVDYVDFPFFVPSGMAVNDQAFIEVFYANSPLVDIENSGLTIFMNDTTIGGIQYDENGDGSMRSANIAIPPYLLRPGMNILTIEASNQPPTYCSDMIFSNTWTTVYEQTALHLPMTPDETTERGLLTLGNVNSFLSAVPGLELVGFVVAPNSPAALDAASKIAFELGTGMVGEFVNLNATFADQLTDEFKQSQELILVGKAAEIPLLSELQEQLPAPFEENSNIASEFLSA